jgi:hypothetical protein
MRHAVGSLVIPLLVALALAAPQAAARPCQTLKRVAQKRSGLTAFSPLMVERPPADDFIDSTLHPIRLHTQSGQDDQRRDAVLAELEAAWAAQVVGQGYPAPLSDGGRGGSDAFDVYLVPLANRTAFTAAEEEASESDGKHGAPSFMVVDNTIDDAFLASFIHHEFAHALQFGIDSSETLFLFEASASLQEMLTLPEDLAFAVGVSDFQNWPNAPIFTNGIDWAGEVGEDTLYEYGGALFLLYLEVVHGDGDGTLIRDLWLASQQADTVEENEPDWMDALATAVPISLPSLVLDFSTWRALVGPLAVDSRGPPGASTWPAETALRLRRLTPQSIDGADLLLSPFDAPRQTGCIVLQYLNQDTEAAPLIVEAEALDRSDGQSLALGFGFTELDAQGAVLEFGETLFPDGRVEVDRPVPAGHTLYFSVCDQEAVLDADEVPNARPVRIALWPGAIQRPDAGMPSDSGGAADGGTDPPPPICSCQSIPGPFDAVKPWATIAMVLIGLGMLIARYRRARKTRASFKGAWKEKKE